MSDSRQYFLDKKKNLFFVIVIYNKECKDSLSFNSIKNFLDYFNLIVVDNSTVHTKNEQYCFENKITYISMKGNMGLAKAYNAALNMLNECTGYVIWADDDTIFPNYFFLALEKLISCNGQMRNIYLPLVLTGNNIYSPTIIDRFKMPRRIKSLNELEKQQLTGINSGMIVNLDIYKNFYRYDERFFLDFIDHDFCCYCRNNSISIIFLRDIVIEQNSFFSSESSLKRLLMRRKIFRKDFLLYCSKNNINILITYKKLLNGELMTLFKGIRYLLKKVKVLLAK